MDVRKKKKDKKNLASISQHTDTHRNTVPPSLTRVPPPTHMLVHTKTHTHTHRFISL